MWELIRLANLHPRVGILTPSAGVGGHCIAVDPWFIVSQAPKLAKLIKTARNQNDDKPKWVVKKIKTLVQKFIKYNKNRNRNDIKIACLGITFKPNVQDLRESPALQIVKDLKNILNCKILVSEPNLTEIPQNYENLFNFVSPEQAIKESDIVLILVAHSQFYDLRELIVSKEFKLDACGILENHYDNKNLL